MNDMRSAQRFRRALAGVRCWDREAQALLDSTGEPLLDCILQNREELIALCQFVERRAIRSYLEIGIWTGRLLSVLQRVFAFDLVAACDHGWAERCGFARVLPAEALLFDGDSASPEFRCWRQQLGPVDLVLIDADHSYRAVRRDFEVNRALPHRFLAFHDITGATRQTVGVGRFWRELRQGEGHTLELIRPQLELDDQRPTMGIGIWSATEQP